MKNLCSEEKKFLQGVWGKAAYLEYLKTEEDVVKRNQKKAVINNIRISIVSILILVLFLVLIKISNFDTVVVVAVSVLILALGSFCEYMEERGIII